MASSQKAPLARDRSRPLRVRIADQIRNLQTKTRVLKTLEKVGARSGDRTRIALRLKDFKSFASTSFAIRAMTERFASYHAHERWLAQKAMPKNAS